MNDLNYKIISKLFICLNAQLIEFDLYEEK